MNGITLPSPAAAATGAQPAERFVLKCQYLDRLTVLRGLTGEDLARPGAYQVMGMHLGATTGADDFYKHTSLQFRDPATGESLPADARLWPAGEAQEVNLGPWRRRYELRDNPALDYITAASYTREHSPNLDAEALAWEAVMRTACDLVTNAPGDGFELTVRAGAPAEEWQEVFRLDGPNAEALHFLDRATWRVSPAGWIAPLPPDHPLLSAVATIRDESHESTLAIYPKGDVAATFWWSGLHSGSVLLWMPGRLIDGCLLYRFEGSWDPSAGITESAEQFETVHDALSALACDPATLDGHLLRDARFASEGSEEWPRTLLSRALSGTTILDRRLSGRPVSLQNLSAGRSHRTPAPAVPA